MSEKNEETETKKHINSEKNFEPTIYQDYGYFFYPERWGKIYKPEWWRSLFSFSESRAHIRKTMCESNVKDALENRNN